MAGNAITQPGWNPLVADQHGNAATVSIPARPEGLWTKVADFIPASRKLKIVVTGNSLWAYDPDKASCGPEGVVREATGLLVPSAAVGCLVGKVGGSTADNTAPPAAAGGGGSAPSIALPSLFVFAAGSFCMVQVADKVSGPLFLTMNDAAANFSKHVGALTVQVFEAA